MIDVEGFIRERTNSNSIVDSETIQSLWSGYGCIIRYILEGGDYPSVVVKHVQLPDESDHPRGWNTDLSHQRKLKSYKVETAWYQNYSRLCNPCCRVPECLGVSVFGDEVVMILEDVDASGFPGRKTSVTIDDMHACLKWLACFHATFLEHKPDKLWEIGTYWHLETRPDELEALDDVALKNAAQLIDVKLKRSSFQTFVHGDAKLANFCFSDKEDVVAAVDFQYVGGGCGMKDVAYFIGSCLYEDDCEKYEQQLLDYYFAELKKAIEHNGVLEGVGVKALEEEWRSLFPYAWTDFHRFIKGWSPGHWKINDYSEKLARYVLSDISNR